VVPLAHTYFSKLISLFAVSSQWQSNGACQTTCQGAGYYLAIVQYTLCWCTNYAPSTTVPVANCSNPCPGFPYESCGSQANNLFGYIELSGYTPVSSTVNTPSAPAASSTKATSVVQAPTVIVTSINTVVSTRVVSSHRSSRPRLASMPFPALLCSGKTRCDIFHCIMVF